jgi:trimeric autotransporter adhesin
MPICRQKETALMFRNTRTFLLVAVALVAVGCAQPPQAQIDAATAAITKATAAGAEEYAPETLAAARDAQAKLDAEVKAQAGSFFLTRSYGEATTLAAAAAEAGDKAATEAVAQKAAAQKDAAAALESTRTAIQDAEAALAKAPKGKGSKADLEALQADIAAAKTGLGEAETAQTGEHYKDAKAKADAAREKAAGVTSAVNQAAELKKGAVKKG